MEIIVCIKQVPETGNIKINPQTNTLIREGVPSIINPMDMYAIEEGLRIKEKSSGRMTVITMGPPQADAALRESISLGADDAILISDKRFSGADTWATAYTLAQAIKKIGHYDLILCGKQAIDGDTAQVGPELAEMLGIPIATYVRKIEEIDNEHIRVHRMMEDGYDVIDTPMPALLTVVKEINIPRLPSLKGKMKARKAEITVWTADDLNGEPSFYGLQGSPTWVVKIFSPDPRPSGRILTGKTSEMVAELVKGLKETKII
ncbi:electron transfer flavoprotein subunit beta/FixA family protein [bacterium]|nr:electron transfer flavoprotein subunit beta/FixA family protein [bacterium]